MSVGCQLGLTQPGASCVAVSLAQAHVLLLRTLTHVQVYVLYIGLLLSALNRLPLKLPQKSPGRRHQQKAQTSAPVSFDDVAGVDEAKEELTEIVVRPCRMLQHAVW